MPLDTSIALGAQAPQFKTLDPMTIYQAMQDQRVNALREQMLQQEMAKNAMVMQNTMEDRRLAAAQAAQARRQADELKRMIQGGFTPGKNAIMGPGTIQGSTPASYDYEGVKNKLIGAGNVGGFELISKLEQQEADRLKAQRAAETERLTGGKIQAETQGINLGNVTKQFDIINAGVDRAVTPDAMYALYRAVPDALAVRGQTPETAIKAFDDRVAELSKTLPPDQAFAQARMEVANGAMAVQKQLSELATAKAGRTDVITGSDGNTYMLDKTTGTVTPTTMVAPAGAPATAGVAAPAPAGAPAAAPTAFRAAPTTDAQIKQAAAKEALPGAVEAAELTLAQLEEMVGSKNLGVERDPSKMIPEHPGFQSAVGGTLYPLAGYFSGTDTSDFNKRLEQVKGGAFLKAYETLKGTGQITEKEGEKATAAITRMDTAQSEKEFILAAKEFKSIIESAVERAKTKMRGSTPAPAAANAAAGGGNTPNVTPNGVSYSVEE